MDINPGGGLGFRIEKIWAFIAVHNDGDEGIVGLTINGNMIPAIGADHDRIISLLPEISKVATMTGMDIKLVRFDNITLEATIRPSDDVVH